MPKVTVVTDSAACLPPALAAQYDIEVVPLTLVFQDHIYADGSEDSSGRFYQHLRDSPRLPTTASPSPGDFLEALKRVARRSEAALCITVGSRFSSAYDSALQAARLATEEAPGLAVRILDSDTAAMAEGFLALEAARVAAQGADVDAALERARQLRPRVKVIAILDTLEYLARGGRVPRVAAWASSLLQVKPIVEFRQGDVRLLARTRVKRRAMERVLAILAEEAAQGPLHVCIHHTDAAAEADELARRVRDTLNPAELYISEFTRVMGAHTGPGLLGASYYVEDAGPSPDTGGA